MVNKALVGLWATCVLSALHPAAAIAAPPDVVLYASDAANLHGNWARVADATAAGGQLLASTDKGWATTSNPLAAPADYFDFTFNAVANTPYHLWTRIRATGNNKYNDSLFAQFSDTVDAAGTAVWGLGTTGGVTINLASDAGALSVNLWGWQDGAYWLTQPKTVTFAATGSHTLRIQTREDGVQLDQVVLSAALYLTSAPGTVSSDTHIVAKPLAPSTPYTGTALSVPGTIEADAFDNGGEGLAYHDATPANSGGGYRDTGVDLQVATENGYNVGWVAAGEWLNYSVNVATTADYLLEARVASYGPGGAFHVEFAGRNVTGTFTIPNTGGWQNWTTVSTRVALTAGPQVMRVVFDTATASAGDVGNFNWLRLSTVTSAPFSGAAIALPGTLHAENFDNGGEGLGYHDVSAGNTGGQYRSTDVDIEPSSLGGFNVGWMDTNEWLAYSVNVATTGAYTVRFQVASATGGGQLHASFGPTNTTTAAVPNTGGWQTWTTVTATANLDSLTKTDPLKVSVLPPLKADSLKLLASFDTPSKNESLWQQYAAAQNSRRKMLGSQGLRDHARSGGPIRGSDEQRRVARVGDREEPAVNGVHADRCTRECSSDGIEHEVHAIALGSKHLRQLRGHRHRVHVSVASARLARKLAQHVHERAGIVLQLEWSRADGKHSPAADSCDFRVDPANIPTKDDTHVRSKGKGQRAKARSRLVI